ncbi:MAG: nucleoside triphosphate pyrophosphatase [Rhodospirillaceae bacterium]
MAEVPFILASGSAVRHRLLAEAGVPHAVEPADIDEAAVKARLRAAGGAAADAATALAEAKARAVAARHPEAWVLGCDQILDLEGAWFDKAGDLAELRRQLLRLRGRTHVLVSALCLVKGRGPAWTAARTARLAMREFSDEFLEGYLKIAGREALQAVGGYSIEGRGAQLFARVEGDLTTVMGLPLMPLLARLRRIGILPS